MIKGKIDKEEKKLKIDKEEKKQKWGKVATINASPSDSVNG